MRIALASTLAALTACMVFDESMRRPKSDGGASSSSSTSTSSSSGADGDCSVPVGGAGGVGGLNGLVCPGKIEGTFSGEREAEPNDHENVTIDDARCGSVESGDVDRFSVAVAPGDCLDFTFISTSATATISGPGLLVSPKTVEGSGSVGAAVETAGTLEIAIAGTGAWRFVVRR